MSHMAEAVASLATPWVLMLVVPCVLVIVGTLYDESRRRRVARVRAEETRRTLAHIAAVEHARQVNQAGFAKARRLATERRMRDAERDGAA